MQHSVFTDTMHTGTIFRRGNWYAQFYSTEFGSSRAHPMMMKGYAHETLSLLFKRDCVTPNMVIYGSKEQTIGLFRNKCQDADFHIEQTDPFYI